MGLVDFWFFGITQFELYFVQSITCIQLVNPLQYLVMKSWNQN